MSTMSAMPNGDTAGKSLLAPLPRGPISETIVERIIEALIDGSLEPGDKLPTEMEFSEKLGIGRNTVREAIKVLVAFGVLEVRRAEGTFVVEKFSHRLLDPMIYGLILSNQSMADLLEFKITFLHSTIYLAMQKATNADVNNLRKLAQDYREAVRAHRDNIQMMYDASAAFHRYLGTISHNNLLDYLNEMVMRISKFSRVKAIEISSKSGQPYCLADSYDRIVDVIEFRNIGLEDLIEYIMDLWKRLLL